MTMDKLFDGSAAHLLPGNAALIERLRHNPAIELFAEAADALEAADKRIAELEQTNCSRLDEAERNLAVAREALKETTDVLEILRRGHGVDVGYKCYPAINIARDALEQIGVDDEQT